MLTFGPIAKDRKYLSAVSKTIVLLTAGFPYGTGEAFLAAEVEVLAASFERVVLVPSQKGPLTQSLPKNVTVKPAPVLTASAWGLLLALFQPEFWKEMGTVRNILKMSITWPIFKTALRAWADAQVWKKWLNGEFPVETGEHVFYTYWCDQKTLALTQLKKQRPQDRFITRLHGWDVYRERHTPPYLPYRRYLAGVLDALVFISEKGRTYVQQQWQLSPTNLRLFRLGTPQPLENQVATASLHLVSCSGLIPLKRVAMLQEAVILLGGQVSWTHLGDGPERTRLEGRTKEAHAERYITFLGNLSNPEVHTWLAGHTGGLFINVSETEGLPVSVMEAMSYGFPVLATQVGGTDEIVQDGYSGFLLPANPTPQEVATAISHYLDLPDEVRAQLSKNAFTTWKEMYSAKTNYLAFSEFLQHL